MRFLLKFIGKLNLGVLVKSLAVDARHVPHDVATLSNLRMDASNSQFLQGSIACDLCGSVIELLGYAQWYYLVGRQSAYRYLFCEG